MLKIRHYNPSDEDDWINCHHFAYYNSIYYDELVKVKPRYETPSIELIGVYKEKIVGILDIEIEQEPGQFCFNNNERGGMISVVGVHPQYRRKKIATRLIEKAYKLISENYAIHRLEIWVRDDIGIKLWLEKLLFQEIHRFYEVLLTTDFFDKYAIDLPYEITPISLMGIIESKNFSQLTQKHPPESTFPIIVYEKLL
ncbi:MAG: GNAT family N-acetyltransferase [Promethearchaeota archaeon]